MSSEDKDIFADSEEIDDPAPSTAENDKNNDSMDVDNDSETVQSENVNKISEKSTESNPDDKDNGVEVDQEESLNVLNDKSNVPDQEDNDDTDTPTKDGTVKLFRFPQGRVKSIMKLDPEVGMVNGEAIFLVNKAVEEFIQCLAVESYHHTASSKKKTITKEHVMTAIESIDELAFLDGAMDD